MARIELTGKTDLSLQADLPAIADALARDFDFLDLQDKTERHEDYKALASDETSLGMFIRTLNEEINDATDPARRQLLERAREVGIAAYRNQPVAICGLERDERGDASRRESA